MEGGREGANKKEVNYCLELNPFLCHNSINFMGIKASAGPSKGEVIRHTAKLQLVENLHKYLCLQANQNILTWHFSSEEFLGL